jgi:hypothetical protein
MSILHITAALIERIDHFGAEFNAARMGAIAASPGNPYNVEVIRFGEGGVACKARHPLLRSKNRIYGLRTSNLPQLDDLVNFFHSDGLPCLVLVPYGQMTEELFVKLVRAGLWSTGNGTVPAIGPDASIGDFATPSAPQVRVRLSEEDEKGLYLDIFQRAFADRDEQSPEYRAIQWAEDSLPGGKRYIAEIDGRPVGMASFPIIDRIGFFGTAGVLPEYRGHGVQMSLIRRRLVDAHTLDCDLILGGSTPSTPEYRNFERAGLRLVPCGSVWREVRRRV